MLFFHEKTIEKFPLSVKEKRATTCGVRRDFSGRSFSMFSMIDWSRTVALIS
jgi:hypothetical protein